MNNNSNSSQKKEPTEENQPMTVVQLFQEVLGNVASSFFLVLIPAMVQLSAPDHSYEVIRAFHDATFNQDEESAEPKKIANVEPWVIEAMTQDSFAPMIFLSTVAHSKVKGHLENSQMDTMKTALMIAQFAEDHNDKFAESYKLLRSKDLTPVEKMEGYGLLMKELINEFISAMIERTKEREEVCTEAVESATYITGNFMALSKVASQMKLITPRSGLTSCEKEGNVLQFPSF